MEGFIKLHRKILNWEWGDEPNTFSVFVHLLLMANHEQAKWHGIVIERGQVLTSLAKLSKICGISIRAVRTCLDRLKSTQEIAQTSTSKYSIITICKYDSYQSLPTTERHNNRHEIRQSSDKQATTNNNKKNDKKIKKENVLKEKSEEELDFERMMNDKYPRVQSLSKPFTLEKIKKLSEDLGDSAVKHYLEKMENYKPLTQRYCDADAALREWHSNDKLKNQ